MKFEGFQAPNQHTQTPNEFFDEILLTKGITLAEVKLLGFMVRNTFGWQRAGNSLVFTFTQLQKNCHLGRQAVSHAIQKCLDKGYIERKEIAGEYRYRLKIKDYEDYPWELKFDWTKVQRRNNNKESEERFENQTDSSLKIKPVAVRKSNRQQFENQTDKKTESLVPVRNKQPLNKSLNKSLNKKIKYNLSMKEQIETSELPTIVKKSLIQKTDRLIDEKINIDSISCAYYFHKSTIDLEGFDYYFSDVLRRIFEKTKNRIRNVRDVIDSAINNDFKSKDKSFKKIQTIREEKVPDWLRLQREIGNCDLQNDSKEQLTLDFDEKQKFEALISKFKD